MANTHQTLPPALWPSTARNISQHFPSSLKLDGLTQLVDVLDMTSFGTNPAVNAWSAPSVVEQARSQLRTAERKALSAGDTEIARQLRSERNMLTKVCALPAEMLATILWWCSCSGIYTGDDDDDGDGDGDTDIVQLTHVCRLWRSVALATPQLWTYHSVHAHTNVDRLKTTLERARGALLDLEVALDEPEASRSEAAEVVRGLLGRKEGMSRVRRLALVVARAEDVGVCKWPAPALESFDLSYTARPRRGFEGFRLYDDEDEQREGRWLRSGIHIEAALFGDSSPALRQLALHNIALPWTSFIFHSLTSLQLSESPTLMEPKLDELLTALHASPNLEFLELSRYFPLIPKDDVSAQLWATNPHAVNLPRLEHLIISRAPFYEYAQVLNHLHFPATARVRLEWVHFSGWGGELFATCPQALMPLRILERRVDDSAPSAASGFDSSHDVCLSIEQTPDSYVIQLHLLPAVVDAADDHPDDFAWYYPSSELPALPVLDATFLCPFAPSDPYPRGLIHLSDLNLPAVHTLKLAGLWPPAEEFWRGVLHQATAMRRLSVGLEKPQVLVGLLRALTPKAPSSTAASPEGVIAPQLAELHLTGAAIKSVDPGIVVRVLDARARAGVRLGKVTVDAAHVAQGFAEALGAELVGEGDLNEDESVVDEVSTNGEDEDDSDDELDGDDGEAQSNSGESDEERSENE
ncbi:hypothetical protein CONPUDRAFT_169604 [Coniophora puteana RWD-64-598 SS2]|uniref:Uncharacterized protein n=1 Tax=Coniophora puteana (strain RWD-64-598) TaxID=741705 RepID=A0A5M3M8E6_CONPW|nr:uncharacterized protein CONPUDRAFT_169604 [Coniophora puteana RWD-64-598 SS2]EIW75206.1 hypothetical protein CONPUDRAFT_169604 [Coniophora puteana RWD-64-598 SS2]